MRAFAESGVVIVARRSLEDQLWAPRTVIMGLVALTLPALGLGWRVLSSMDLDVPVTGFGFFSVLTATVGFQFAAPMLALFYSSGVVADEKESGNLTYLLVRPRSRAALLGGKMLGSWLAQVFLFSPALVLSFYVCVGSGGWADLGARFPILVVDLGVVLLGLAAYSGLFALAGVTLRRPVLVGLLFVFGWQPIATYVPGWARYLTVAHYLQSLLPHESFQGALASFLGGHSRMLEAVAALLATALATHGLAITIGSRKEHHGRT